MCAGVGTKRDAVTVSTREHTRAKQARDLAGRGDWPQHCNTMVGMMRGGIAAIVVVVGCAGSKHDAERARLEAAEPVPPYDVRSIHGFTAPNDCGQGPYRVETKALGSRFGEQIEVMLCAPRHLQGDYQVTSGGDTDPPKHWGSRNESGRCTPTASERAQQVGDASGGGVTTATSGAPAPARDATSARLALVPAAGDFGETCPDGTHENSVVAYYMEGGGDGVPLVEAGSALYIDIWSGEPLDLDGATFIVIQRAVHADMTPQTWQAYRDAKVQWRARWNSFIAGEVSAGRSTYVDGTARSPDAPPPPRVEIKPPQPSAHAEWIAGFWQREGTWVWSAGFWRVPDADIAAEQTVEAPVAPPPVKVETPSVAASATLVWTPGYWAWDGRAYLWIEGAWRIPPSTGAQWVAPTWKPRRGRQALVPGGWSVRIGR